jgi:hypothetical protein
MIDSLNLTLITVYDVTVKARISMPLQPMIPVISPANSAFFALFFSLDNRCL